MVHYVTVYFHDFSNSLFDHNHSRVGSNYSFTSLTLTTNCLLPLCSQKLSPASIWELPGWITSCVLVIFSFIVNQK